MEILFEDDHLIAVNKPHGLLVHRSKIAYDVFDSALKQLSKIKEYEVHPIHRLDRKTSGILMFAKSRDEIRSFQLLFSNKEVVKTYLAIVRGYTDDAGTIDYPITNLDNKTQEAVTHYRTLERVEIPIAMGKHETSRYSLVEITPETGRMHQIRKHFSHLRHPIINDRKHGCNKQNRMFKNQLEMTTMYLHAYSLKFIHPITRQEMSLKAPLQQEFQHGLEVLGFRFSHEK
jgi:tRNA pseudouridine65 synthase